MIQLFRRIRQKLLSENSFSKYLVYALGEIILVVAGILIALQINNSNENSKLKKQEVILLENLRDDIALDTVDINFNIEYHKKYLLAEQQLLQFLQSDLDTPSNDINLDNALGVPLIISFHRSAFNNLENSQTGLISNNELKKDISRFYDFFYKSVSVIENDLTSYQFYNKKMPYFKKYFDLAEDSYGINVNEINTEDYSIIKSEKASLNLIDVEGARNDNGFKIELNESIFKRQVLIGFYEDLMNRVRLLLDDLEKEIELNTDD